MVVEELVAVLNRSREAAGRTRGAGMDGSGAAFRLSREAEGRTVLGTGRRDNRGMALGREGAAGRPSIFTLRSEIKVLPCLLLIELE